MNSKDEKCHKVSSFRALLRLRPIYISKYSILAWLQIKLKFAEKNLFNSYIITSNDVI